MLDTATPLTMVLAESTGGVTTRYWHGLDTLAQSDGTTPSYFAYDGLGSVRQLVGGSGSVQLAQTFDPYGSGYATSGSASSSLGYSGEQVDANGFVYLRARYYNPSMGRFFQMDPSRLEKNPYLYGMSNPILHTDPSGLFPPFPDPLEVLGNALIDFLKYSQYLQEYLKWATQANGLTLAGFAYEFTDILTLGLWGRCDQFAALITGGKPTPQWVDSPFFELGRWWARLFGLLWAGGEAFLGLGGEIGGIGLAAPTLGLSVATLNTVSTLVLIHSALVVTTVVTKEFADPLLLRSWMVWAAAANAAQNGAPKPPSGGQGGGGSSGGGNGGGSVNKSDPNGLPIDPPKKYAHDELKANMNKDGIQPPSGYARPQVHHDLPWVHKDWFAKRGLYVNDSNFGRWVNGGPVGPHQSWGSRYQNAWTDFIDLNPTASQAEVLAELKRLLASGAYPSN